MDEKTQRELTRITMGVPKELGSKLMKQEVNTTTEELVKKYLRDNGNRLPSDLRRQMYFLLENGAFQTKNDVVDEKVTKQLDYYFENEVKKSKKKGKLSDPRKDSWLRQHMAKMSEKYGKKKTRVEWRPPYCSKCGRNAERVPEYKVKEIEAGLSCRNCHPEDFQ